MQDPILPKQADLVLLLPSRRHPTSRRVAPTRSRSSAAEYDPALGDRDAYTGRPRRYVWSDGCVYEGEWRKGRPDGRGRFWWPSGATYVGEFRAGRMEGEGAFVGVEGESYCGQWADDRKHGFGEKRYANGDSYRGEWRRNLQDGEGEYRWSNGNEYRGGWRNGVIHGRGALVLGNGDRYHGVWDNGVPKGKGVLCSSKCSASVCGGECSSVDAGLPKICIWELDGEAGDITCDIVDNVDASAVCKGAWESNEEGGSEAGKSPSWNSSGDGGGGTAGVVKKPGQIVCRGHKNYELIVNLQLGIRYSVGKHSSIMRELSQSDFEPHEKFWTRFPPEGSKNTPPHQSTDFRWEDYCPMVFRHLRELFAIDAVEYMLAICGSDALREFSSPGKSGSFFYLTQDDRFMIKTVKKSEVKVLTRMLPSYYQHVCQYNNTLVTKFFGLHCIKLAGGQKVRFIVMGNLFASEYRIHKRFDLKGSSYGRTTDKGGGEIDETVTLKDLDLNFVFRLERSWFQKLIRQINRDCELLEGEGIMDYSLLVGLHFCDGNWGDKIKMSPKYMQPEEKNVDRDEMSMRGYHLLPNMDWVMESRVPLIRLGTNMHARAERVTKNDLDYFMGSGSCNAESGGEVFDVVLYFGIIDILQDYDITKRLEHAYKSLQVDATSISAVDPKLYSRRFRDFIHKIFVEDM